MDISLSASELRLVNDAEVLLTKNKIIQKVYEIFGCVSEEYKKTLVTESFFTAYDTDAKIARGENYKGLPYVILDYPREFAKVDVFAVRTFFWWGNFFSITLQLGGAHQYQFADTIKKAIDDGLLEGWFIGCSDTPWEHHFNDDNYQPICRKENYELLDTEFLKIAKKIPLHKWDEVPLFLKENFTYLLKVLSSHAPIL